MAKGLRQYPSPALHKRPLPRLDPIRPRPGQELKTISTMLGALDRFEDYLDLAGAPYEAVSITPLLLMSYMIYLQQKPAFSSHPFARLQPRLISDQTVHCYCRSLRVFLTGWRPKASYPFRLSPALGCRARDSASSSPTPRKTSGSCSAL